MFKNQKSIQLKTKKLQTQIAAIVKKEDEKFEHDKSLESPLDISVGSIQHIVPPMIEKTRYSIVKKSKVDPKAVDAMNVADSPRHFKKHKSANVSMVKNKRSLSLYANAYNDLNNEGNNSFTTDGSNRNLMRHASRRNDISIIGDE